MKLLTATHLGQGEKPGDFCFATEGELVFPWPRLAGKRPEDGDVRGVPFSGMLSQKGTTTALVRELDYCAAELQDIVAAYFRTNRMGVEFFGDGFSKLMGETASFLEGLAREWPVGTVLGRGEYELVARAPQSG